MKLIQGKALRKYPSKYPVSIQVPETHTTDTHWRRENEVDNGSPIISDKGGQTIWRTNHAPFMPKRGPSILEQHEQQLKEQGKYPDSSGIPDGYQVDTILDTFSNKDTERLLGDEGIDSIHLDTKETNTPPVKVGCEIEYTYHGCSEDEQHEVVRNKEHPKKGTKGIVLNVYWFELEPLGGDWMLDVDCDGQYYTSAGMDYVTALTEVTSNGS